MRTRISAALDRADARIERWPLDELAFSDVAEGLREGYRRARHLIPDDWRAASAQELHELRQRVVVHRYQMEIVEPLWPRLGRSWVREAQKLRTRLGSYQDLAVLARYAEPHQPLARWRSRLQSVDQPAAGAACRGGAAHRRPAVRRAAEGVPQAARSDVGRHGREPLSHPAAGRAASSSRTRAMTLAQSPVAGCRNSRTAGYQGLRSRSSSPAPVRLERQQHERRPAERAGDMRDRGVDADRRDRRASAPRRCRRSRQARRRDAAMRGIARQHARRRPAAGRAGR